MSPAAVFPVPRPLLLACCLLLGVSSAPARAQSPPRGPGAPPVGRPAVVNPVSTTPPRAPGKVKFTFWNVEWFPGRRPDASELLQRRHVAAVTPVVTRLDPDVLGLEEVGDAAAAALLADALPGGYRVDVVTDFHRETGEETRQQTVLASRLPLINAWWETWKPGPGGMVPRRGFAFAAYQPVPGQVLLVYGLHLKSNRVDETGGAATNYAMRTESVRQLIAHAHAMAVAYAKLGAVTVVLGGDLNTSLDDPRFAAEPTLRELLKAGFRWAWQDVPAAARVTLPGGGRYPDTCFDHIFFRAFAPAGVPRVLDASIEPTGRDCSDHRPVSATMELRGK